MHAIDYGLLFGLLFQYSLWAALLSILLWPFVPKRPASAYWAVAIPAAIAVGGMIMDWLNNKKGAEREDAYNDVKNQLYNKYLKTRDQGIKAILGELERRGVDIYGPQVTTTNTTETETPFITPEYQKSAGLQRAIIEKRLASPTALPAGFEETGISAINQSADKALNDLRNLARSRGQNEELYTLGSPSERERLGGIAGFRANLPLKERELRNEDLALAQSMVESFGRGTSRRGHSTTTSPVDLDALMKLLLPIGPNAPDGNGTNPSPGTQNIDF